MRKMKILALILSVSIFSPAFAVEVIDGIGVAGGNNPFAQAISVKTFDRYTGSMYVGTAVANATFSIASAGRSATAFTALADDAGLQIISTHMGIMNNAGAATTHIAVRDGTTAGLLKVIASTGGAALAGGARGAAAGNTINICDTAGAAAGDSVANAFTLIEGGYSSTLGYGLIFLRVMATAGPDNINSGILAFKLTAGAGPLVRVGNHHANNHAVRADTRISGATDNNNFLRAGSASAALATEPIVNDIFWDASLEKLFVAGSVTTVNAIDFHSAILTTTVIDHHLGMNSIIPVGIDAADNQNTTVFATNCETARHDPRILKIRTMHTSTGKVYLIVNGGIGNANTDVGNTFFALRYDKTDGHIVQNNATRAEAGSGVLTRGTVLADNFTRTLAGNALDGGNTGSLVIGGIVAPWAAATAASDMEVVGDTVYASLAGANRTDTIDPGIWASTAMFDKDGVIIGWTRWERVFTSDNTDATDRTPFFAVDAYNNKLWHINNAATTVSRSAWITSGFAANSLAKTVDDVFEAATHKDCTCVLDLPDFTPGISPTDRQNDDLVSLALFGGYERVIFARTKYQGGGIIQITTDFSLAINFLDTTLPAGAGTVRSLGLARTAVNETRGYFFAGTDLGLWVYATTAGDHIGYNPSTQPTTLAAAPFAGSHSWIHMDPTIITGAVTAIDSDGTYMYVVEQDISTIGGIVSKLRRYTISDDVTTMIGTRVLIAQSGSDGIPVNTLFTGFSLATARNGALAGHVGILATNAGTLQSREPLSTLNAAGSNPANIWSGLDIYRAYTALKGIKRVPTDAVGNDGAGFRFIGTAFEDSSAAKNYFQDSTLRLYGVTAAEIGDSTPYTISDVTKTDYDQATAENRIMSFWEDGGRRFTTYFNGPNVAGTSPFNMLASMPFALAEWNMTAPFANADTDGERIYWTENISGLGIIMAGTTTGVIALQ